MAEVALLDAVPLPLPGDPEIVGAQARVLSSTASALRTAISELRQLASDDVTISEAVDEIRVKADGVRENVEKVEDRYSGAATAMFSYKTGLTDAQNKAEGARARVSENNTDANYWRRRLNTLTLQAQSGESSQELLDDIIEAKARVATYAAEFASAMSEYRAAEADRVAAVNAAIQALHDAAESSGLNDNIFDYIGLGLEVMYEWAQENLTPILEAIRSIAELLKSIIDILSLIVTILALFLPFLAPLAAALTLASLALAAIILLSSLLLFALGKETLGRVIGDAIGLAVGVITAKMGGLNVLKPGAKLAGLSNVFTRSAWATGAANFQVGFAFSQAVMGTSETVAGMGLDIAGKLFGETSKLAIKFGSGVAAGIMKEGVDVNLDFFPEGGNGGMFGPFEGGWEISEQDVQLAILKPVVQVISGGISNPIIAMTGAVTSLNTMVSAS